MMLLTTAQVTAAMSLLYMEYPRVPIALPAALCTRVAELRDTKRSLIYAHTLGLQLTLPIRIGMGEGQGDPQWVLPRARVPSPSLVPSGSSPGIPQAPPGLIRERLVHWMARAQQQTGGGGVGTTGPS